MLLNIPCQMALIPLLIRYIYLIALRLNSNYRKWKKFK